MIDKYKLESLYFYWVNCDDIWCYSQQKIDFVDGILPDEIKESAAYEHSYYRLLIAYGLLYIVVEAYQQFKLVDDKIDALLKNTVYVDQLRKLRNSVFHFQSEFMDAEKVTGFIRIQDSHIWGNNLKKAFEDFFVNNLPFLQEMKNKISKNKYK